MLSLVFSYSLKQVSYPNYLAENSKRMVMVRTMARSTWIIPESQLPPLMTFLISPRNASHCPHGVTLPLFSMWFSLHLPPVPIMLQVQQVPASGPAGAWFLWSLQSSSGVWVLPPSLSWLVLLSKLIFFSLNQELLPSIIIQVKESKHCSETSTCPAVCSL